MGTFISAGELKSRCPNFRIQGASTEYLEDRYITPAEREIESRYELDLETSRVPPDDDARAVPSYLRGTFDSYPDEETKFQDDMKRCVVLVADAWASNPDRNQSISVKGVSVSPGDPWPPQVTPILTKWLRKARAPRMGSVFRG